MSNFTRLGGNLWDWQPWVSLENPEARILWLALYTTPEARRICPGLWHGSATSMAEAARRPLHDTLKALDDLLAHEMVEFDPKVRVLRLTELPDAGEYPYNGNIIRGWWGRFRSVPQCAIRDAHIRTIRWIIDQGAADTGKPLSHHHDEAWAQTFATIPMPSPRRRGVKRVADSDTSTVVQPSLFPNAPIPAVPITNHPCGASASAPTSRAEECSVDNSGVVRQMNNVSGMETIREQLGEGEGEGEILICSGSEIGHDPPDRSRSENVPRLTLVPPFTLEQALEVLRSSGRYDSLYDDMHMEALSRAHQTWVSSRLGLEDFSLVSKYMATCTNARVTARDLPGIDMVRQVKHARDALAERDARLSMLEEFRKPTSVG